MRSELTTVTQCYCLAGSDWASFLRSLSYVLGSDERKICFREPSSSLISSLLTMATSRWHMSLGAAFSPTSRLAAGGGLHVRDRAVRIPFIGREWHTVFLELLHLPDDVPIFNEPTHTPNCKKFSPNRIPLSVSALGKESSRHDMGYDWQDRTHETRT